MKLSFDPQARAEVLEHIDWYEARRPGLGDEFADEVERAVELIATRPHTWPYYPLPRARMLGVRHLSIERFPFSIVYVPFDDVLFVAAVAHMSRKPGYWLRRVSRKKTK